jgi:hypothetical protein
MTRRTRPAYRLSALLALAGAALFATSGVALADSQTGQVGHYLFKDDATKGGATCVYSGSGTYTLTKIVVKAPALWWPNNNSSVNREHGKVGWQLSVLVSKPGAYGPWHTWYMTTTQVKTAYEDQPAYDAADKAPLATWTLNINAKAYKRYPNAYAGIEHTAFWYASNSSTMGSVVHDQFYFKWQNVPAQTGSTGACPIHYSVI